MSNNNEINMINHTHISPWLCIKYIQSTETSIRHETQWLILSSHAFPIRKRQEWLFFSVLCFMVNIDVMTVMLEHVHTRSAPVYAAWIHASQQMVDWAKLQRCCATASFITRVHLDMGQVWISVSRPLQPATPQKWSHSFEHVTHCCCMCGLC